MSKEIVGRNKRLRHFNHDERRYVLRRLANGNPMPEIVKDFQDRFPNFGSGVDAGRLKKLLSERVRNIKRHHSDVLEAMETPSFAAVAQIFADKRDVNAVFAEMEFMMLDNMWLNTPPKSLLRVCMDSRGKKREVYKYNTSERLQILVHAAQVAKKIPEAYLPLHIPITDAAYRYNALEALLNDTPIKSFQRYSRKDKKDLYTNNTKVWLRVLKQLRKESENLREDHEVIVVDNIESAMVSKRRQ